MLFKNRRHAGTLLAEKLLTELKNRPIVLALTCGGVPVAFEISKYLRTPFDILAVRKIGAPHNPELAVGAISEDGTPVFSKATLNLLDLREGDLSQSVQEELREIKRQVASFRRGQNAIDLKNRNIIIVDDGIATGATAKAATRIAKNRGALKVTVAVPVAAANSAKHIRQLGIELVSLEEPEDLLAVSHWFFDFQPVTDKEVSRIFEMSRKKGKLKKNSIQETIPDAEGHYDIDGVSWNNRTVIASDANLRGPLQQ